MKQEFRGIRLSAANKERLEVINSIIDDYSDQDLVLTLRQLYYQLVSRDIIPNDQKEYKKLSKLLKEGRMAGIVDWSAIEDRLRVVSSPSCWESPKSILGVAARQYRKKRLAGQKNYMEIWVEKDALSNVIERAVLEYQIPVMVNRGYSSVSAMYEAYQRFESAIEGNQRVTILYIGDHDPSGQDMIRDVFDRIGEFLQMESDELEYWFRVKSIALTTEQVRQYNPPPNPAKLTDTRSTKYVEIHGEYSWEVDALPPDVLNEIIVDEVLELLDFDLYQEQIELEKEEETKLNEFIEAF
jgi:hypothetical protein